MQRSGRRVRTLAGRYLWVRLSLHGNGRDSPEIAALRIHGPRFSYRDHYLPRLYRETEFGPAADARVSPGAPQSSPADFLERFLGNVEGWLTMLEDRVAAAHLTSDPDAAAEPTLDWLGGWIGVAFDAALPLRGGATGCAGRPSSRASTAPAAACCWRSTSPPAAGCAQAGSRCSKASACAG